MQTKTDTLTPITAIRHHCLECKDYNVENLSKCNNTDCSLHEYRKGSIAVEKDSPIKLIKMKCEKCSSKSCTDCYLYQFNL